MGKEQQIERATFIYDRLYGHLEFTDEELALFQTKELARLRQVSLSAIPTWTIPTGVCASKFEHSVGVGHLAKIVGRKEEFRGVARDLYFAALAHDLGTPPFSHASEYFQIKIFGKNHEAFVEEVIDDSEFADEVERQGGNIDRIVKLVKGEAKPISDIINGSIDIDNLDNTLRYGLSMGIIDRVNYSPERLAEAYSMRDGDLVLAPGYGEELKGWEITRRDVYEFVDGEANLSTGMMLFRALDFASREGQLPREFFMMTDAEAFIYLSTRCNPKTRILMDRASRWIFYPRVFNFASSAIPEGTVQFLLDSNNRGVVADEISQLLKVEPEDVSVYLGRSKGFRKIHIPILQGGEEEQGYLPGGQLTYMIQVYVHPRLVKKAQVVQEYMEDRLKTETS